MGIGEIRASRFCSTCFSVLLAYICTPTAAIGFYCWKVKAENIVKIKRDNPEETQGTVTKGASVCTVTNIYSKGTHKYHLKSNDGKGVYGWVNTADIQGAEIANPTKPANGAASEIKVGDIVQFKGGSVYVSSAATKTTVTRGASRCKVTVMSGGAKHPLHLIGEDGKGVYGWVDSANVTK